MILQSRDEYHKKIGNKILGLNECPFCCREDQKGHTIWKGKYWYILHNIFPYSGNDQHIMAVPYEHKIYFTELSNEEILELRDVGNIVKDFYNGENYFSCIRETLANRSIEHLHIHYIPGKLQGKYLRKMLEHQGFPIKEELN